MLVCFRGNVYPLKISTFPTYIVSFLKIFRTKNRPHFMCGYVFITDLSQLLAKLTAYDNI